MAAVLARACRLLSTTAARNSVYQDSYLDALDRKKRSRSHESKEFDTLGTWDTRLNVRIDEDATFKTGHVVPDIDISMIGVASVIGRRPYQEDRYCVKQLRSDILYLAMFDGHGGAGCAEYCQHHLERHLLHHLDRQPDPAQPDLQVVLEKSFRDVQRGFERWYHSKGENLGRASSSGTTATICLIQDNYRLHMGHCGDSRAILCREGQALCLTRDHCASLPGEGERIRQAGGSVKTDTIGRVMVNDRLCMSRSIGDLELKKFGVSAEPEVGSKRIRHGADQFLVLTSDGINFVMQDQEVVDCVNQCEDCQEGAARLVDQALLYSCEDNATAVIVPFGSWGKGDSSSSMFYSFGRNMSNSCRFS